MNRPDRPLPIPLPRSGSADQPAGPHTQPPALRRNWLAGAARGGAGLLALGLFGGGLSGCAVSTPPRSARSDGLDGEPEADIASSWPDVPMLLLGELHDNPIHHALRAEGLMRWLADPRPSAVAFEPFGRRHDAALQAATRALGLGDDPARPGHPLPAPREWTPADLDLAADRLAEAGQLDRRGWAWPLHRPLVVACLRRGARIVGANLEPEEARAIARHADAALPADLRRVLEADTQWSKVEQAALEAHIDAGHCGLLPPSRWPAMALAQRARDAAMALALQAEPLRARGTGRGRTARVALIAGNGHVRRDLGVPRLLTALGLPSRGIWTVGYLEASSSVRTSTEPAPALPAQGRLYDQVIYTRSPPRGDPCAGLARRLPAASTGR